MKNKERNFAIWSYSVIFLLLLSGCARLKNPNDIAIALPTQDLQIFVKESQSLDSAKKATLKEEYLKHFFSP